MHTPVLLKEAIEGLNIKKGGLYIDATAGEGGHLFEIAKHAGKVLGIDTDSIQIQNLEEKIKDYKNIQLVRGNFREIETIAKNHNFLPVDGILFDLGLSMHQLKNSKRGFSYKNLEEPLDMRINSEIETSAFDLINNLGQNELYEIFARYGEEISSLAISKAVVLARPLKTVSDLTDVIDQITGEKHRAYARIFQALRIAVNDEIDSLKFALEKSLKILKKNGRLVIISFHSLEDRTVKQFITKNNLKQLNKKIIKSEKKSGFERSAKMRVITYEKSI